jgi:hypothetical protein
MACFKDSLCISLLLALYHAFCPHNAPVPAEKRVQDVSPAVYANAPEGTKLIEENNVEYLTYLAVERKVTAAWPSAAPSTHKNAVSPQTPQTNG